MFRLGQSLQKRYLIRQQLTLTQLNSLKGWHDYFAENSTNKGGIPWNTDETITAEERRCISQSIAIFQLGESSEGHRLLEVARVFARKYNNKYLAKTTQYFIQEEQNHALLLEQFMTLHRIILIQKNWTDTAFRMIRRMAGYEQSITVLITAEIIALVYYKALKRSTNSVVLARICDKILADEAAHVSYESEVIRYIHNVKPSIIKWVAKLNHRLLFTAAVIVVYLDHQQVLNRGGYSFSRFWQTCWLEFTNYFYKEVI